jgi:hypothetical protein
MTNISAVKNGDTVTTFIKVDDTNMLNLLNMFDPCNGDSAYLHDFYSAVEWLMASHVENPDMIPLADQPVQGFQFNVTVELVTQEGR